MEPSASTTVLQVLVDQWLQTGDPKAREELLARAKLRLERLARKMLNSFPSVRLQAQTDDVLQGALLRLERAFQDPNNPVRPNSAREFIGVTALQIRRELLDLAKHYGCQRRRAPGSRHIVGSQEGAIDPEDSRSRGDLSVEVLDLVDSLPASEREVFHLLFCLGLSQPEAAELLDVSVTTIYNRYHAAKVRLRELLA